MVLCESELFRFFEKVILWYYCYLTKEVKSMQKRDDTNNNLIGSGGHTAHIQAHLDPQKM